MALSFGRDRPPVPLPPPAQAPGSQALSRASVSRGQINASCGDGGTRSRLSLAILWLYVEVRGSAA
jgi:hypothetical protein